MSIIVKTLDGIISEIYGCEFSRHSHGDPIHTNSKMHAGTHYFSIGPGEIYEMTKADYNSLRNTDAFPRKVDLSKSQVYFRYHRGTLADAMKTAFEVKDLEALRQAIIKGCEYLDPKGIMNIDKHGRGIDNRIGWDTYIVTWDKQPIGFLSGDLK